MEATISDGNSIKSIRRLANLYSLWSIQHRESQRQNMNNLPTTYLSVTWPNLQMRVDDVAKTRGCNNVNRPEAAFCVSGCSPNRYGAWYGI
jgi:hypothetical protein